MRARSATTGSPPIDLPSASGRTPSEAVKAWDSRMSRSVTCSRRALGSSMPIALRPGTTATRALLALIERAISSASEMMRDVLVPRAGSSSNSVTTGPGLISRTSPLTPKSASTSSSSRAVPRSTVCENSAPGLAPVERFSMLSEGRL